MLDQHNIDQLAAKHAVSAAAVRQLAEAIERGGGSLAQFSHPELGGTGQWMRGGMMMIGDMFNDRLKARVAALCIDVADAVGKMPAPEETRAESGSDWWPAEFGIPSAVGSQNAMRYAFFPASKRLVIDDNGQISTFDTGEHVIIGVSQQQSQAQSLAFATVRGTLDLASLTRLK
jgi:hypothetical protein